MNVIQRKLVLILNKNWVAIEVVSHKDAFRLLCKEHARALDTRESYTTHNLSSWIDIHSRSSYNSVNTVSLEIPIPEIIILTSYNEMPKRMISFSKRNLLIRDDYTCGYCQCEVSEETGTIDHIHPQSEGGETSWTNCITACRKCNNEKDNSMPEGKFKPRKRVGEPPHYSPLYHIRHFIKDAKVEIPLSWKRALGQTAS